MSVWGSAFGGFEAHQNFAGDAGGFFKDTSLDAPWAAGGQASRRSLQADVGATTAVPMKIGIIQKGFSAAPMENRVSVFDGQLELCYFTIIGWVRTFTESAEGQKFSFVVDDGTGIIEVEWPAIFMISIGEESSSYRERTLEELRQTSSGHGFIHVFGEVLLMGRNEPAVKGLTVRTVRNPLEIVHHQLRVIDLAKQLRGPPANPSMSAGVGVGQAGTMQTAHRPPGYQRQNNPWQVPDQSHAAPQLQAAEGIKQILVGALRKLPWTPDGVNVEQVHRAVRERMPAASINEVQQGLHALSCEGICYFTRNESWWRLTDLSY